MAAAVGRRLDEANRAFSARLYRDTPALCNELRQQGVCTRVHPIAQRCARWLLMTQDHRGRDPFPLTQAF
jgi:hypothetical protein